MAQRAKTSVVEEAGTTPTGLALAGDEEGLRRFARRVIQDPERLAQAWLAAAEANLRSPLGRHAALLRSSLTPLCHSLCHARLADAELHVTELVFELHASGLEHAAIVQVLSALQQAFAECAPRLEWSAVIGRLGAYFLALAAQTFAPPAAADPALETHVRPSQSGTHRSLSGLVGNTPAVQRLRTQIAAIATAPGPVLIVGPSGTGKELVARAVHRLGPSALRPWLAVNCAALPHDLIESELFGHERGAFTGSRGASPGLMRAAADGTLFLDEITEMPPGTQAKLLRALEQRTVRPVGGVQEWPIRARVVAATNRDPLHALAEGRLRPDLFYRLCVHRIEVPPLAQHADDVPLLLRHVLDQLAETGQPVPLGFSPRCLEVLRHYSWPGNVRELRNLVEHCCAFAVNQWVELEHLPQHLLGAAAPPVERSGEHGEEEDLMPLHDVERRHIQRALRRTGGNKAQAARLLCLSRHQLYLKLERLGITDW